MHGSVRQVNGEWWGYGRTRTLGPFTTENKAWKALKKEGEM